MPETATSYRFSFGPLNLSEGADSVRCGGKAEDLEILRGTEQLIEGATAEKARRFLSPKGGKS